VSLFDILMSRLENEEGTGPVRDGRYLAYRDSKGILTIGIGRNIQTRGLSREEIVSNLAHDIADVVAELTSVFPAWARLDEVRQSVLADIYFNMRLGDPTGFAQEFAPTLSLIAAGHYAEAAEHMRGWKWYDDVGPRRADPLIAMMQTGIIVTNGRTLDRQDRRHRGRHQRSIRVRRRACGRAILPHPLDRTAREDRGRPTSKSRRAR
jgi:lysozyme